MVRWDRIGSNAEGGFAVEVGYGLVLSGQKCGREQWRDQVVLDEV